MNEACGPICTDTKSRRYGDSVHASNENLSISEHNVNGLLSRSMRFITDF